MALVRGPTMRTTMTRPRLPRLLLPALLGALALLGAGCLPSAEDTLGQPPPGAIAVFDFSGGVPIEFSQNGTTATPLSLGTQGGSSGPPSLKLQATPSTAVPFAQCIRLTFSTAMASATYIEYYRLATWAGGATTYSAVLQPSGSNLETSATSVTVWDRVSFDIAPGDAFVEWCIASPTASDSAPWIIELDDVELY
jgi:hypothetical protein